MKDSHSANDGKFSFERWFEDCFWKGYPRKVNKNPAKIALSKIVRNELVAAEVLSGLERWQASAEWWEELGKFVPHASTWVNAQRWQDEPESVEAAKARLDAAKGGGLALVSELPREAPLVVAPKPLRPIPSNWFPGLNEEEARHYLRRASNHLVALSGEKPTDTVLLIEARRIWRSDHAHSPVMQWEEGYAREEELELSAA